MAKKRVLREVVPFLISYHEWFTPAWSKNIYPGGSELIEKAKEIAEKPEFKGSCG